MSNLLLNSVKNIIDSDNISLKTNTINNISIYGNNIKSCVDTTNININACNITLYGSLINTSSNYKSSRSGNINLLANVVVIGNVANSSQINGDLTINGNITKLSGYLKFNDGTIQTTAFCAINNNATTTFINPKSLSINNKGQVISGQSGNQLIPGLYKNASIMVDSDGQISGVANGIIQKPIPLLTPGSYTNTNIIVNPDGYIDAISSGSGGMGTSGGIWALNLNCGTFLSSSVSNGNVSYSFVVPYTSMVTFTWSISFAGSIYQSATLTIKDSLSNIKYTWTSYLCFNNVIHLPLPTCVNNGILSSGSYTAVISWSGTADSSDSLSIGLIGYAT